MLITEYGSTINKALTPAVIKELTKSIAKYVDYNSEILMSMDLSKRYSFGDSDRRVVYEAITIPEEALEASIKNSKYIHDSNKIQSNPFYSACVLTMNSLLTKKNINEAKLIMTYMSLMMYTSIHKGCFKFPPNKQIMDYTIAHLDMSFIIRNVPSLYAFISNNTETTFETYKSRILKCEDKDITWVVDALWTRLKGKIMKIANAFYENHKEGNYLNADSDSQSEGDFHEIDNNSFMVARLSGRVHMKIINRQVDDRYYKYAITRSDVSLQKLKNLVDDIVMDDENNVVKGVVASMIEYFLLMSGKDFSYIGRGDFITYMKTAYASNSDVNQMVFIKRSLDMWVDSYMVSSGRTHYGKTAKTGYKKALYMYLVFVINNEAHIR